MKFWFIFLIIAAFLAGLFTSQTLELATASGTEVASPSDRITENQIKVYDDHVLIKVEGAEWASFANTNSMDPFLDQGANALQFIPESPEDINIGDIISYKAKSSSSRIIHRVVFIGEDEEGLYYIVKGDNNKVADPGKVRFDQVDRVLFAIIY